MLDLEQIEIKLSFKALLAAGFTIEHVEPVRINPVAFFVETVSEA